MEELRRYVEEANKAFDIADHMTHTTYTVVKDPKLLLLAATHLNTALEKSMNALLHYEYLFKRITRFPKEFSDQLDIMKRVISQRYNIPRETIQIIIEVREIVREHKAAEMEFRRKNKFIIASKNFRLRTLTIEKLKNMVRLAKPLLSKINEVKRVAERLS